MPAAETVLHTFPGEGEMAALCRALDWASTPLGPVERWPRSLRVIVSTLLCSRHPMFLFWGPEHVQFYNDAYRPSLGGGGRHPRALGMRGHEFWTDIWDTIGPQIEQVMNGGEATWHEDQYLPIYRNDRLEDVYWTYSYSPVPGDDGRVSGVLVVCTETTSRVQAFAERDQLIAAERAARAEAEAANLAKAEFLAIMSHELRTPLNAISGYAELLEMGVHGPLSEPQRRAVARVQLNQRHLLGLINEVLNYAKLETGTVHYEIEEVRLCDLLATVEGLVEPLARSRGLALVIESCPSELIARADPEKLRQILVNLLSNSVKFTDSSGRVEVRCGRRGDRVEIAVHDTGIGIPADKLETIFEPFVQVRSDLTRPAEGTGLGLAISRDLARGMGGELTVESSLGAGSTFTLTLMAASDVAA